MPERSDNGRLIRPVVKEPTLERSGRRCCPSTVLSGWATEYLFGLERPPGQDDWVDEHDAVINHAADPARG